jgi:hypothetical protein
VCLAKYPMLRSVAFCGPSCVGFNLYWQYQARSDVAL